MGMGKDYISVWDSCLQTIRKNVPLQSFKTWFEPIQPVRLENSVLTIQVPSKFFYEWLEEHHVSLLKTTIRKELGDKGRLEYQILVQDPANIGKGGAFVNAGVDPAARAGTLPLSGNTGAAAAAVSQDLKPQGMVDMESIKNPFVIPGIRKVRIDSQLNIKYQFDNYIEGDCNRLARAAGVAVAKNPGETAFNPLVIFGDTGLGKTHLAQAIGNHVAANQREKSVLYVSSEKFANQIIHAIKTNSVTDFVNFYQLIDVLIVDDIQFLANKHKTQEIFFHIFNQLHQNRRQVVLTSDRPPQGYGRY